ncbi:hypothetical protein HN695_04210 [Candidatus Woesearchaeota archaeon]|jgi:hypothetical protein|nr:hypothetical protein [Candidatus Woesearchaeota archaeon]MBT5272353.1 hypothetical protein [Candidatus Woesearchaeota archaeon]MBT6336625.1 hypothetical protein [Candidatus Woesearchaeota archaeon]MBT7927515.1 hypothetical protein [Candidatus Woesearchaeota archaeon]
MFKFIKELFKKKPAEELKVEEILFEKVGDWVNQHTSEIIEDIDKEINESYERLVETIKETKQRLEELKKAELRNDKIALRAKQIMEGNRTTYISRAILFLDSLDTENRGFFTAKKFYKDFQGKIGSFNKQTIRSYYVLQEFLANESSKVAEGLKNIDKIIREIRDVIDKSPISDLDEIKTNLKEFKEKQAILSESGKETTKKKQELESYREAREKVEKKILELKKGPAYLGYKRLDEEREDLKKQIKDFEDKLSNDFSLLSRPLRKYSRVAMNESLVAKYATSPVLALLSDEKQEIIEVLKKLKENIKENKVELKDKQKEKTLQAIERLSAHYFKDFLSKHSALKSKKKNIDGQLLGNSVNQDYNDMLYKQEHFIKKCKQVIEDLNHHDKSKNKAELGPIKEKLENMLGKMVMKKVVIVDELGKKKEDKEESSSEKYQSDEENQEKENKADSEESKE